MNNRIVNLILALVLAVSVQSCYMVELPGNDSDEGFWESPIPYKGNICAVGVEYPDGYDWHTDSEYGTVPCSLFVWADGHKTMKLAVGNEYEISSDPDKFRLAGGDLYTDFSTQSETVFKKNGKQLFRYSGREMIVGFALLGDDVYTLGNSRGGRGLSLRKNGEILYSNVSGTAFRHLDVSDKGYGFCFYEDSPNVGEGKLYSCIDGRVEQIDLKSSYITKVYDAAVSDGRFVCLGGHYSKTVPVLVVGNDVQIMENAYQYNATTLVSGEICFDRGDIFISGLTDSGDAVIWKNTNTELKHMTGSMLYNMLVYSGFCLGVVSPDRNGSHYHLVKHDKLIDLPSDYMVSGLTPACLWQGDAYVAMSSRKTDRPIVWSENHTDTLDVNGKLYSVQLVR